MVRIWYGNAFTIKFERLHTFLPLLNAYELVKFHSLRRKEDKHCFLYSHLLVRLVIVHSLDVEPSAVLLEPSRYGKPVLRTWGASSARFDFNLSHAGEHVLCAVNDSGSVGVDVERVSDIDIDEVARVVCSDAEFKLLVETDSANKIRHFFRLWTLKEAYLKARGVGLNEAPSSIEFNMNSVIENKPVFINAEIGREWHAQTFDYGSKLVASMIVQKVGVDSPCFELTNIFPKMFITWCLSFSKQLRTL